MYHRDCGFHIVQFYSCFEPVGRASATPSMDLLITLLSWGVSGYKKMLADRKEMFAYLQQKLSACAAECGERLLNTRRNPISMGRTLSSLAWPGCSRECGKGDEQRSRCASPIGMLCPTLRSSVRFFSFCYDKRLVLSGLKKRKSYVKRDFGWAGFFCFLWVHLEVLLFAVMSDVKKVQPITI